MKVEQELDRLLRAAKAEPELKKELFAVGQDASDAKLRSVNGGGVNPIDGWDDAYEQFFLTLIWT